MVDFATPRVQADELVSILDFRLPTPQGLELQAVSILASVAERCVRQEGKERPSMTYIVTRLEQAFSFSCNNHRKLQPAPQESSDQYNNNNNAAANSSIANWIHQEIEELGLKRDDDDDAGDNDDDDLSLCGDAELHHLQQGDERMSSSTLQQHGVGDQLHHLQQQCHERMSSKLQHVGGQFPSSAMTVP